jgi:hypothetical protein
VVPDRRRRAGGAALGHVAPVIYAELYGNPHLATAIRVAQNELNVRDAEWQARQRGRR